MNKVYLPKIRTRSSMLAALSPLIGTGSLASAVTQLLASVVNVSVESRYRKSDLDTKPPVTMKT